MHVQVWELSPSTTFLRVGVCSPPSMLRAWLDRPRCVHTELVDILTGSPAHRGISPRPQAQVEGRNLLFILFFKKRFYLCLERGEGREKDRERNIYVHEISVASRTPPMGDSAHNPGMCPDWESNR